MNSWNETLSLKKKAHKVTRVHESTFPFIKTWRIKEVPEAQETSNPRFFFSPGFEFVRRMHTSLSLRVPGAAEHASCRRMPDIQPVEPSSGVCLKARTYRYPATCTLSPFTLRRHSNQGLAAKSLLNTRS